MEELKADIKEIKGQVFELVKQGEVHNYLLKEHERRSLAMEAKLEPIEKHVSLVEKILKTAGAMFVGIVVHWIVRRFLL